MYKTVQYAAASLNVSEGDVLYRRIQFFVAGVFCDCVKSLQLYFMDFADVTYVCFHLKISDKQLQQMLNSSRAFFLAF
jgi:hypothetical protein